MKLSSPTFLKVGMVTLSILALPRAVFESWRLLFGQNWTAATDLKGFHNQVVVWFSGENIYQKLYGADYPPASYPIMYPQYILPNDVNRWVWFAQAVPVLALLIWMLVRESGARTGWERACVALLPLATFSTGVALGNGQMTIHALAAAIGGMLLLYESRGRLWYELAAAACMLFALVKPNLTAPFFWIFLLIPRRKIAAVMVIVGYVLLTLFAASFQPGNLIDQFRGFVSRGTVIAGSEGYGNIPIWLGKLGYGSLIMPFTFISLLGMGIWVWMYRRADRWLLFGGLAIMIRLWAYHRLYDDMLNLLAFVALLRLAWGTGKDRQPDQTAWIIMLIALTTLPGTATPLEKWQGGLSVALRGWQTTVRLLMLALIVYRAHEQMKQISEEPSSLSIESASPA